MKPRVGVSAAFLSLLLCLAFLFICANTSRNALNNSEIDHLADMARIVSAPYQTIDTLNAEELGEPLREITREFKLDISLIDSLGETIFESKVGLASGSSTPFQDPEVAQALKNGSGNAIRKSGPSNIEWLISALKLENGAILRVYRPAFSATQALNGQHVLLVACAILLAVILYLAIEQAVSRMQRLVRQTANVLEAFSEGDFDARLPESKQMRSMVTPFNEYANRIQERLFKQKGRNDAFSTVLNHMQTGMLAVDSDLNIMLVTPVARRLLGFESNSEGRPIKEVSKDVYLDDVLLEAMHQDGVYTNEVAARTNVGRNHRPLRLYVSPMIHEDKVVGAIAMVEDITELRRLEEMRTDFVANVSHELKTPLTSIKGFVETLQAGAIHQPEKAEKFLNIIMMEADRLTRLINDILSISKLESGKDPVVNEKIRLDKMIHEIADMLSIHASEKQIALDAPMSSKPVIIMGNPDRLEQMLINLIDNGIKYNQPGGSVSVRAYDNGDQVNLTVSDTGIGIAEENLPRMFERFYRVDKGRSRSMGGTGLGLAIVKHIVMSMGGMIEVHSKFGSGTEFLITLPKQPPSQENEQPENKDDFFDDGHNFDEQE